MLDKLCPRSWLVQLNSTWERARWVPYLTPEIESLENGTRLPLRPPSPFWLPERSWPSSDTPKVISPARCPREFITQNLSFLLRQVWAIIAYVLGIFVVARQVLLAEELLTGAQCGGVQVYYSPWELRRELYFSPLEQIPSAAGYSVGFTD